MKINSKYQNIISTPIEEENNYDEEYFYHPPFSSSSGSKTMYSSFSKARKDLKNAIRSINIIMNTSIPSLLGRGFEKEIKGTGIMIIDKRRETIGYSVYEYLTDEYHRGLPPGIMIGHVIAENNNHQTKYNIYIDAYKVVNNFVLKKLAKNLPNFPPNYIPVSYH